MHFSQTDLKGFLKNTPLTNALTDTDLADLVKTLSVKSYEENESIFRVGDKINTLRLVIEGRVRFDLGFIEGQNNHIGFVGPGEHFGDLEILTNQPSVANVVTQSACTIALMPADIFLSLFRSSPQVSQALAYKFAILFHLSQQVLAISISETVDKKLALLLLSLDQQIGVGPKAQRTLELKLVQEDLANMLGVTRQAISKPLQSWKREGWISFSKGMITLNDIDKLKELASFRVDLPNFGQIHNEIPPQ